MDLLDRTAAQLTATAPRRRDRILARLHGATLDRQIAFGAPPDGGRRRSARAAMLVDPDRRRQLAGYWESLLEHNRHRPPASIEGDIRHMIDLLRVNAPVPARGVAMSRRLLTDGTGPVYQGGRAQDLRAAVQEANRHLDPASPLLAD
jgi:hypothetical protein